MMLQKLLFAVSSHEFEEETQERHDAMLMRAGEPLEKLRNDLTHSL